MSDETNTAQPTPPWLRATAADLVDLDFEAPIATAATASCDELGDLFSAAMRATDGSNDTSETAANRINSMLAALAAMHFKSRDRNDPFGPMIVFADGRRSAISSDFRQHVDLLAVMAERAANPVLRARLADLCWLLDRKRAKVGAIAIAAYGEIVQKTDRNELKYRFATEEGALQHDTRDYLRRALQIGRAIGWDKAETMAVRADVKHFLEQAIKKRALVPIQWFCELDLEFGISDAAQIGASLDGVLADRPSTPILQVVVNLWRLAAHAYHLAKMESDKNRCLAEAAERLVEESQATSSALLAADILGSAIAQLHGIPDKRERRTELRHKLVDLQARVPEEMASFSQELDLRDIAEEVQEKIGKVGLLNKFFIFAALGVSPDPKKLTSEAVESIKQHPLSSLFGASFLDREGKVIHRSQGGGFGDDGDSDSIRNQIAQSESIRRKIIAFGQIEAARQSIADHHFILNEVLASLLQYSPFVPSDLLGTFAHGFTRFFQGDFVSATYILTPLLENSLRYILKSRGHDVSIFDDATQTQEDRTISTLFEQMRDELDAVLTPAIAADIEHVFLTKPGPHLRHALVHGLLHDGDPYDADAIYGCWLIFRLCLLPLFPHRKNLKLTFD